LAPERRTDTGAGEIAPERRGVDFFPYKPPHLAASAPRPALARITNSVQEILASGKYDGAIWTEGSPRIEETIYWLNLLVDTTVPICGNAAQRMHGMMDLSLSLETQSNVTKDHQEAVWAFAQKRRPNFTGL
jgi:L-asparaginase